MGDPGFGVRRVLSAPPWSLTDARPAFLATPPMIRGRAGGPALNLTDRRAGAGALDTPLPPEAQMSGFPSELPVLQLDKLLFCAGESRKLSLWNPPRVSGDGAQSRLCGRAAPARGEGALCPGTQAARNGCFRGIGGRERPPRLSRGHVSAGAAGSGRRRGFLSAGVRVAGSLQAATRAEERAAPPGRIWTEAGKRARGGGGWAGPGGPAASAPGAAAPQSVPCSPSVGQSLGTGSSLSSPPGTPSARDVAQKCPQLLLELLRAAHEPFGTTLVLTAGVTWCRVVSVQPGLKSPWGSLPLPPPPFLLVSGCLEVFPGAVTLPRDCP